MLRAFIFDLDGTLYLKNSELYQAMSALIRKWFKTHLKISDKDMNGFYDQMKQTFPNVLEAIQSFGLSLDCYHREVFGTLEPDNYLCEDKELQHVLHNLYGNKFLVTQSSLVHAEKVLRALGISQFFPEIYTPERNWNTYRKVDVYQRICKEQGLLSEEVCVVGDNYTVDIEPARDAGFSCILISENDRDDVCTISSVIHLLGLPIISRIERSG